jgi:hypothetical protein
VVEHATRQRFGSVASGAAGDAGARDLVGLLDGLASRICEAAAAAPLEQLMTTLPRSLDAQPQAVLALLDIVATDVFEAPEALAPRLAVVDCVITSPSSIS